MIRRPSISPEKMNELRERHKQLRPLLDAEMQTVREHWQQELDGLSDIVNRHNDEIAAYIAKHGPMTRGEVVERALSQLLSEV